VHLTSRVARHVIPADIITGDSFLRPETAAAMTITGTQIIHPFCINNNKSIILRVSFCWHVVALLRHNIHTDYHAFAKTVWSKTFNLTIFNILIGTYRKHRETLSTVFFRRKNNENVKNRLPHCRYIVDRGNRNSRRTSSRAPITILSKDFVLWFGVLIFSSFDKPK